MLGHFPKGAVTLILLAILLPPVAVLICGKPFQAIINCFLCLFLWVPGVIHAIVIVNNHNADKRHHELLRAQAAQTAALIAAQQARAAQPAVANPTPPGAPQLGSTGNS